MLRKWVSGGIDVNAGDYDKRTACILQLPVVRLKYCGFCSKAGLIVALVDRFGNTAKQEAMREQELKPRNC